MNPRKHFDSRVINLATATSVAGATSCGAPKPQALILIQDALNGVLTGSSCRDAQDADQAVQVPIGRLVHGVKGGLYGAVAAGGKPAHSDWRVLRRNANHTTLVSVLIRTGMGVRR